MEHAHFVADWKAGRLQVEVHRSLALQVANSNMLPRRYQLAHIFWSWVWILSIPAALAVMFLYRWWAGLLMLVLLTPLLSSSTKTSAMQFIIDHALENAEFYEWAVENKVLIVSAKT